MSKAVYIATTERDSGKSIISLGLMQLLLGRAAKVGYFRPIIDDLEPGGIDNHINTITRYFNLDISFEAAYAFTRSEVIKIKNEDRDDELIGGIIEKYKTIEEAYDFVLVEGTSFSGEGGIIEFDINVVVAKNLGIPAILIASGVGKTLEGLVGNLQIAYDTFKDKGVKVLAVVGNKVRPENRELVIAALKKQLPASVITDAIPLNPVLANPSVKEICDTLGGEVLFGEAYLNNQVDGFSVGAMQLRNYLSHLKENGLVITPGDRADIIWGPCKLIFRLTTRRCQVLCSPEV